MAKYPTLYGNEDSERIEEAEEIAQKEEKTSTPDSNTEDKAKS